MKRAKPYLLLFWNCTEGLMERHPIKTLKEARAIIQAEYMRTRLDHVFGQVVNTDDSRTDIFPKKLKPSKRGA